MYSILYFVVTLCVVNASIVVVNVFDEADQTSDKGVSNCKESSCYQLCRNLGYSSDACLSKYCKCDNYEDAEDGPETPQLENDLEGSFSLETCNNQECDQRCRRMKFPGGVCVNGRCKCDNFLTSKETESEDRSAPQSCNMQECDQRCRRLKFPGGVCVNGRCKCDNFLRIDGVSLDSQYEDNNEEFTLRSCNYQECNQRCRRLKFPGGACVNGRCKCDNFRTFEDVSLDSQNEDNNEVFTPRSCNNQECDQRCRRLKFPGGACVNGRCKCDNFLNTEDFVSYLTKSSPARRCNYQDCNHQCQKCGFSGGVCVNNRCRCNCPRTTKDDVTNSQQFNLETLGSAEGLKCNAKLNEFCDRLCRILKYDKGTCVDGTCKCFKKDSDISNEIPNKSQDDENPEEPPIMEEYSNRSAELISQLSEADLNDHDIESRSCNGYRCNNTCKALHFARGVCRSGKCYCSK